MTPHPRTKKSATGKVYIGTSGWSYSHWGGGVFYPPEVKQRGWLEYFARHFSTVELNNTFYCIPRPATFAAWRERTPDGFFFALKANRRITHLRKLRNPRQPLQDFIAAARELKEKAGPILFQLPPNSKADVAVLGEFLRTLRRFAWARARRWVFEFRHPSWLSEEIFSLLRNENAALCFADWPKLDVTGPLTADFAYIRRHGSRELYASGYSDAEIERDAREIARLRDEGHDVYVYFNNDAEGHAVADARRLMGRLDV